MRLDVHVVDVQSSAPLTEYTQSRLWLGLQRHARRILCAGVWLTECAGAREDEAPRFACRIDLWLRRIGHVTVRHVEDNAYVAVDLAVARARRAVSRRVRRVRRARRAAGVATVAHEHRVAPSRQCIEYARPESGSSHWLAHRVWEDDGGRHRAYAPVARGHVRPASRQRQRQRQRRELVPCA
jgi:hypothetical protein